MALLSHPCPPIDVLFADGTRVLVSFDGDPAQRRAVEDLIVEAILDCDGGEDELSSDLTELMTARGLKVLRSPDGEPAELVVR